MRYFYDCEFDETGETIRLISIAIVCEDGRELYEISSDFDEDLCNPWVKENVLPKLPSKEQRIPRSEIRNKIEKFIGDDKSPELYSYYSAYDHVCFCWLWGAMVKLPQHFPMLTMDLKQWQIQLGKPKLPAKPQNLHNALEDARWHKQIYDLLSKVSSDRELSIGNTAAQ